MSISKEIDIEEALDLVEELQPEEKEDIKKWVKDGKSIDVLVTGKTGVGKSSLLNYLLGKTIFEVGKRKESHCTSKVTCEESERNGIKIRAWDSPGLQDGTGDAKYLKGMQDNCSQVDLMLYCISMEEVRSDLHIHTSAIRKINDLFTKHHWSNTVFVLTFANAKVAILKAQELSGHALEREFKKSIAEWRDAIRTVLIELKVDRKIVDNISVVPAGRPRQKDLPGYKFWLSYLWSQCLCTMKKSAQAALVKMEKNRGFIAEDEASEEIARVSPDERKIVYTRGVKVALGVAAGGGTVGGAAAGATIGALIGALAIGIPSFGVAAGAGLGIGAAVGGFVGAGTAAAVGTLIALYRKNKLKVI